MLMPSIFRDDLFDNFFGFDYPIGLDHPMGSFRKMESGEIMKVDVKESDSGYEMDINLPGYKKEDVKAELKDGYLTISALTSQDKEEDTGKYIRRERYTGSCSRNFYVGKDVFEEDIKAKFEEGVLKLFVPKKDAKPAVEEKKYIAIE